MNVFCSAIGKIYKYNDKTQYFLKFISLNKITTHWHSANGHLLLLRHFRISTFYPFPMSFYGFTTSPIFVLEKFRKWWAQLFISGVVKNQFQVCPQIQYLAALFHLWNFLCKSTFFQLCSTFYPEIILLELEHPSFPDHLALNENFYRDSAGFEFCLKGKT